MTELPRQCGHHGDQMRQVTRELWSVLPRKRTAKP